MSGFQMPGTIQFMAIQIPDWSIIWILTVNKMPRILFRLNSEDFYFNNFDLFLFTDVGCVISKTTVVTTPMKARKCAQENIASVLNLNSNAGTENAFPEDGAAISTMIVEMELMNWSVIFVQSFTNNYLKH
jgi:hypothetical protein